MTSYLKSRLHRVESFESFKVPQIYFFFGLGDLDAFTGHRTLNRLSRYEFKNEIKTMSKTFIQESPVTKLEYLQKDVSGI